MPEEAAVAVGEEILSAGAAETVAASAAPALAETAAIAAPGVIEASALPALGETAAGLTVANAGVPAEVTASLPTIGDIGTVGSIASEGSLSSLPSATVSSSPVAPVDVTSSIPATDAAAPSSTAPATAEAPVDSSTEDPRRKLFDEKYGTTAGPGGPADPYYKTAPDTSIFKPYTGPTGADISGALKSLGVTPFQAGALGLNAYSQYKSAEAQKTLQQELQRQAQLTRPAAEKLMSQYQSGTIGAAQEKQITDYTNQQKAAIKQRYAKMGRDPNYDSAAQQEMANVDVQAASMRDSALQNVLSSGLKAAGVTGGPAQQAIMAGYQQDQAAQKAQADFLAALANMQARSGTGTQTTPSAPPQD